MSNISPFSPDDIIDKVVDLIPKEIINAINELLFESYIKWASSSLDICYGEIAIKARCSYKDIEEYRRHIALAYKYAGWQVNYGNREFKFMKRQQIIDDE